MFEQHDVVAQNMHNYAANATASSWTCRQAPWAWRSYRVCGDGRLFPSGRLVDPGRHLQQPDPAHQGSESTLGRIPGVAISPLIADAPFMKAVDLDLANRWSQFKLAGWVRKGPTCGLTLCQCFFGNVRYAGRRDDQCCCGLLVQGFRIQQSANLFPGGHDSFEAIPDPCVAPARRPHCAPEPCSIPSLFGLPLPTTRGWSTPNSLGSITTDRGHRC